MWRSIPLLAVTGSLTTTSSMRSNTRWSSTTSAKTRTGGWSWAQTGRQPPRSRCARHCGGGRVDHPRDPLGPSTRGGAMTKRIYGHTSRTSRSTTASSNSSPMRPRPATTWATLIARRGKRGRPRLGSAPSTVESVRLDPDLKERLATARRAGGTARLGSNPRGDPASPQSELTPAARTPVERRHSVPVELESCPWQNAVRRLPMPASQAGAAPQAVTESPLAHRAVG